VIEEDAPPLKLDLCKEVPRAMTYQASTSGAVDHVVVLMLENRSFDHMLGLLYSDAGNVSPSGQPFDGLSGNESNPDTNGSPVAIRQIVGSGPVDYFMPGADPGEGFAATNLQLYASDAPPEDATPAMNGFVTDFSSTLSWETKEGTWDIVAGTTASDIMGVFTPSALPVLSGLAKGFAVSDRWFSSVPTETMPNRAFASAATSQGHMDDTTLRASRTARRLVVDLRLRRGAPHPTHLLGHNQRGGVALRHIRGL
jgi:phospholipase C